MRRSDDTGTTIQEGDLEAAAGLAPVAPRGDLALVERLVAGDETAFAEVLRRHHGALMRLAIAFVGSRAVAEEVVQETWQAVIAGLTRFERRSSLRTWIFHILVKRARTRGAREARYVPVSGFDDDDGSAAEPSRGARVDEESPERLLLRGEMRGALERAIESLPPALQAVLTLRDIGGWTSEEVCNALYLTETNQRVMLHRARNRVRAALGPYLEARLR